MVTKKYLPSNSLKTFSVVVTFVLIPKETPKLVPTIVRATRRPSTLRPIPSRTFSLKEQNTKSFRLSIISVWFRRRFPNWFFFSRIGNLVDLRIDLAGWADRWLIWSKKWNGVLKAKLRSEPFGKNGTNRLTRSSERCLRCRMRSMRAKHFKKFLTMEWFLWVNLRRILRPFLTDVLKLSSP